MENYIKETKSYEQSIVASKKARWTIEDVLHEDKFDFSKKFLPDGLSMVEEVQFLQEEDKRLISHIQGRTYANMFGMVERFINAKVLEVSKDHWLGDQTALEALVRFSDEEIKHQELFRIIETKIGDTMPEGYHFVPKPNEVADLVLGKSTWAVLALTLHIELFTQMHYKESIKDSNNLSEDFKRVFKFHWMEEAQHAVLDELELKREHSKLSPQEIDKSVSDLIELVAAVYGICIEQAKEDANYFFSISQNDFSDDECLKIKRIFTDAYTHQYILSGVPALAQKLEKLITTAQFEKINDALAPIVAAVA